MSSLSPPNHSESDSPSVTVHANALILRTCAPWTFDNATCDAYNVFSDYGTSPLPVQLEQKASQASSGNLFKVDLFLGVVTLLMHMLL